MIHQARDIADTAQPLAILTAARAAWPLAIAIVLDWLLLITTRPRHKPRHKQNARRTASRNPSRLSPFPTAITINLAAIIAIAAAAATTDLLLAWLPAQFTTGIVRIIAEHRLRSWEALALLIIATTFVVAAKVIALRLIDPARKAPATTTAMLATWSASIAIIWAITNAR